MSARLCECRRSREITRRDTIFFLPFRDSEVASFPETLLIDGRNSMYILAKYIYNWLIEYAIFFFSWIYNLL